MPIKDTDKIHLRTHVWAQQGIRDAQRGKADHGLDDIKAWIHPENQIAYATAYKREVMRLLILGDSDESNREGRTKS